MNKVATAIHLRFDIRASSLPTRCKEKLLNKSDSRISTGGIITIKAQQFRTQHQNKEDALKRLKNLILSVSIPQKKRFVTKPTKGAKKRLRIHEITLIHLSTIKEYTKCEKYP